MSVSDTHKKVVVVVVLVFSVSSRKWLVMVAQPEKLIFW